MRPKDNKSTRHKHIIEIDFYNSPINIDYITSVAHNINVVLNSVDTSILYKDLYDTHFDLSNHSLEDKLIGPVLYREQESISEYTTYEDLIDLYVLRDIKKFFGYTLDEFLNLSRYARMVIVEKAEKHMEKLSEQMQLLSENQNSNKDAGSYSDELNELLLGE